MKVLAICSYSGQGGAELSFATYLRHRPPGVELEALLVTDGPLRDRMAKLGIPTRVAKGYEGRPDLRRVVRFTRELTRLLDAERPSVVWAMGIKAALLAAPACRLRAVPIVWHKIDFSWDRALARPLALGVNGVIAVSQATAAALGPLRRRRLIGTIGPPLRFEEEQLARTGLPARPTIGSLARLVPYKGHHHILRAGARLAEEFPDVRVLLAGAPADEYPGYQESLLALADELGMAGRVEVPGFVPSAAGVFERLSVFVNATYRDEDGYGLEGLSVSMLEASLAGLPVVATRGGGTPEGLVEGQTGALVDDADPDLLAAAIAPYLRDPELAVRTGAAGREFVTSRFAGEDAAKRLFALLTETSGSGSPPSSSE